MAKAQVAARFTTEVAPPAVVSTMRRGKVPMRSLDPIAEDDREQLACWSDHQQAATATANSAWSKRATPQASTGGGFVRDLGKYMSDAHGQRGRRASSHKGHRRVVFA